VRAGDAVKMRLWQEEREIRPIMTGDGIVEVRKGDTAMVVIIERWADADAAIEALRKFVNRSGTEEP
jgi:hypothetical protein